MEKYVKQTYLHFNKFWIEITDVQILLLVVSENLKVCRFYQSKVSNIYKPTRVGTVFYLSK